MSFLDDFDDFQQAPNLQPTAPTAVTPAISSNAGLFNLVGSTNSADGTAASRPPQNQMSPLSSPIRATPTSNGPNYSSMISPALPKPSNPTRPTYNSTPSTLGVTPQPKPAAASTFDDLWQTSLTSIGGQAKANSGSNGMSSLVNAGRSGKTIKDLEKEKAMSSLWGTGVSGMANKNGQTPMQGQTMSTLGGEGGGGDDLLL